MNQVTHECLGQNLSPSTNGWKGRTKPPTSALVKIEVFQHKGGRTNQATHKCLGKKFKFFYLRVEGRIKSLTGALVEN